MGGLVVAIYRRQNKLSLSVTPSRKTRFLYLKIATPTSILVGSSDQRIFGRCKPIKPALDESAMLIVVSDTAVCGETLKLTTGQANTHKQQLPCQVLYTVDPHL